MANTALYAGDQYRSRMYIDIEQDATENVALSVSELENKIDTLQDDYTRASAEKFLAQHYAGEKDYAKAATLLEDAIKRAGNSSANQRDLLGQLARIYLLQKNYDGAASVMQRYINANSGNDSAQANADDYLLLAQIHYKRKQYVDSAAALDKALNLENSQKKAPSKELLQSALAVYYSIGNYNRSAEIIQQLVAQDINNTELWQNWISLLLKAGKSSQALDVMALAWEKGIPFRDQDILLLCDLYSINKVPGRGARVLEEAIETGRINSQGSAASKINDRLFRLWLQAGERDKAQKALEKAALLGDDKDLQLHLAQLYMEKEQWQPMQDMVLKACNSPLPDALVSRANLFLGISQLKLGDVTLARRSFINATILGGENEKAGQWLAYMKADPATEREKIGIAGPCYSQSTRSMWTTSLPASTKNDKTSGAEDDNSDDNDKKQLADKPANDKAPASAGPVVSYAELLQKLKGNPDAVVQNKTVSSQKLYLGDFTLAPEEFADKILPIAIKLGLAITKGGGKINGPMYFIYPQPPVANQKIKVRLGFPVSGNPHSTAGFKLINDQGFKCIWRSYKGSAEGVAPAFAQLYADARSKNYEFTGESRQLAGSDNSIGSQTISLELQIGVK